MTQLCACGEPLGDAFLGKRCSERLRRALGDLPALIADLDITLTRQAVTGAHGEGKPTKKDAQPLPFYKKAGDVKADLRHTLVTAIRHLTEQRGIVNLPADNPPAMARWLLKYADSIRLDPGGPNIAAAVHEITARIMDVVDLPKTRSQFKVGMCPEVDEKGTLCPGEVWAHLPAEDLGIISTLTCSACGVEYEPRVWMDIGLRILKRGAA